MKKGKITMVITLGLICAILTAVLLIQFKTIGQTDIDELETMREEELRLEIANYKTKYEESYRKLEETNVKINEYEEIIKTGQQSSELLQQELKEINDICGKNDVTGKGVIITLNDTNMSAITTYDLGNLLNELKANGAEAISINDQRIVYESYIAYINSTYISVNGQKRITAPYTIKAIGDSAKLEKELTDVYIKNINKEGKNAILEVSDNITIYKYTGDLNFEYVKEEEV